MLELCLCAVIFKTSTKAQSNFTRHFQKIFVTPLALDTAPQLRLWPMFAAADFKPSDRFFNFRYST